MGTKKNINMSTTNTVQDTCPVGDVCDMKYRYVSALNPDWLLRRKELRSADKLVYGEILQFFDEVVGYAWPSQKRLADSSGLSERSVWSIIRKLERRRLLVVDSRAHMQTSRYRFLDHSWAQGAKLIQGAQIAPHVFNPKKMHVGILLPDWIAERKRGELSDHAKIIYGKLLQYYNKEQGHAWPTQERIADECGISRNLVGEAIRELKKLGLIDGSRPGRGRSNGYWFLMHDWATNAQLWPHEDEIHYPKTVQPVANPVANDNFRNKIETKEESPYPLSGKGGDTNNFLKAGNHETIASLTPGPTDGSTHAPIHLIPARTTSPRRDANQAPPTPRNDIPLPGKSPSIAQPSAATQAVDSPAAYDLTPKTITLMPTSLPALSEAIGGGWRHGDSYLILASTGVGKTAHAVQEAVHLALRGYRGLLITTEESPWELELRAFSNFCSIEYAKIMDGFDKAKLSPAELKAANELVSQLKPKVSFVHWPYDHAKTVITDLAAELQQARNRLGGLDYVILDQIKDGLGKATTDPHESRNAYQAAADRIARLATDENILAIAYAQASTTSGLDNPSVDASCLTECKTMDKNMTGVIGITALRNNQESSDTSLPLYKTFQSLYVSKSPAGKAKSVQFKRAFEFQRMEPVT